MPIRPPPPAEFVGQGPERLRAVVKRAVRDAIERVRTGWREIGYDVPVSLGVIGTTEFEAKESEWLARV